MLVWNSDEAHAKGGYFTKIEFSMGSSHLDKRPLERRRRQEKCMVGSGEVERDLVQPTVAAINKTKVWRTSGRPVIGQILDQISFSSLEKKK